MDLDQYMWGGFADEIEKIAVRRHRVLDGRWVDLDVIEPLLQGRSVDMATEEEIAAAEVKAPFHHRFGTWLKGRIPFLFDEE